MKTFKVLLITLIAIAGIAYAADKTFRIDKIIENTAATGVDVDGINIKDTTVRANTGDLTLDSTNQIIISKEAVFQAGTQGISVSGLATSEVAVPAGTTLTQTLVTGTYYIIDMALATGDVTGTSLQAGAADVTMRVALINNPNGYTLNIDGNSAEQILYGDTLFDDVSLGNVTSWVDLTWDSVNGYWLAIDNATFYSGTFNGDLDITGDITLQGPAEPFFTLNKSTSETRAKLYVGGSDYAILDLYDTTNVNKVKLRAAGDSFFNGGNVGIGTSSPATKLEVSDPTAAGLTIRHATAGTPDAYIAFGRNAENLHYIRTETGSNITGATAQDLSIYTVGGGRSINMSTNPSRLDFKIDGTGIVTIGTAEAAGVGLKVFKEIHTLQGKIYFGTSALTASSISDQNSGGASNTLYIGGSSIDVTAVSDGTYKTVIGNSSIGLKDILAWNFIDFTWNETSGQEDRETINHGVVAQEIYKVSPDLVVVGTEETPWRVKYKEMIPYLGKAIQEQQAIIEQEKSKNAMMQAWICSQENAPIALCN